MSQEIKWKVRVLYNFPISPAEQIFEFDHFEGAKKKFIFLVSACLEFPELSVRCVNLILGYKSVKYFQNYSVLMGNSIKNK